MTITKQVPFSDIRIRGGFWEKKQRMVADTTLQAVRDRFTETGRFDAWNFDWREGMPHRPHIFWDSDIAKWIEGVADSLVSYPDPALEELVDGLVDKLVAHQGEDGYFNSYFAVCAPQERWQGRRNHELYCAGHLMEAAVAYHRATGKDRFLKAMCRYADYIDRVFRVEKSAAFATPGHEEIELALLRLYEHTGVEKYRTLGAYFLEARGKAPDHEKQLDWDTPRYAQDHAPIREQDSMEGHAVRAVYLYCGMADLARLTGDEELLAACRKLFDSAFARRMYITGGLGSTAQGEAFTFDYDLPNETAYAETCAAIGLALFARRMSLLEPDGRYADAAETAIYNGFLAGVSLKGDAFFYVNPLEINLARHGRNTSTAMPDNPAYPITRRQRVFECSCCPPNVCRFIASIADQMYSVGDGTLYVHQYMDSDSRLLSQRTAYPFDGHVGLTCGEGYQTLALRIPGWCKRFTLTGGGAYTVRNGYLYVPVTAGQRLELALDMPVRLMEADPRVTENAGRVAVARGPLVFCMEGLDNGDCLRDIRLDAAAPAEVVADERFGMILRIPAHRRRVADFDSLYREARADCEPMTATLIPYYAFANREECDMLVWALADHLR